MNPCKVLLLISLYAVAATPPGAATPNAGAPHRYGGRPLAEALARLRDEGLLVVWSDSVVRPNMIVAAEPENTSPRAVLDELLAAHGLAALEASDDRLVVVPSAALPPGLFEVSVRAGARPLAGVQVVLLGTPRRAETGADGRTEFSGLVPGSYTLEARRPGYVVQRSERAVAGGEAVEVAFELVAAPLASGEITVTPGGYVLFEREPGVRRFLGRDQVRRLPHLADDLFRAIAWLPGTAGGDLSADLHVRGGYGDEDLVMLDGVEVYEPYHLRVLDSPFSTLDAKAIGRVEFLSGAFPVEYGDRLSAVVDLETVAPRDRRSTSLGVSLLDLQLLSDGTFAADRGQWLASTRRGLLELAEDGGRETFEPVYGDLLGKVSYAFDAGHVLAGHVLAARGDLDLVNRDPFEDEQEQARYDDRTLWLTLSSAWSPRLASRLVLSSGAHEDRRHGRVDNFEVRAEVRDERWFDHHGLRQEWTYEPAGGHLVKWGLDVKYLAARYDYASISAVTVPFDARYPAVTERRAALRPSGGEQAVWLAGRSRLGPRWLVELGLRWDGQRYVTPHEEQWSPRVNLAYEITGRTRLRAGWGFFHQSQSISRLQVEDGRGDFAPAQRSEHRVLGLEHAFANGLGLKADWYEKRTSNPRPRFENLLEPLNVLPEVLPFREEVAATRAAARGLEVLLTRQGGRTGWWLSYAVAVAEDEIAGERVARSWDQRHTARFGVSFRPDEKWSLALAGTFHSGWPTTAVTADPVAVPDGLTQTWTGPRNAERAPAFHRLDARATRAIELRRRGTLSFHVEVFNLFDRDNFRSLDYAFFTAPDGRVLLTTDEEQWLERLPSVGLTWTF